MILNFSWLANHLNKLNRLSITSLAAVLILQLCSCGGGSSSSVTIKKNDNIPPEVSAGGDKFVYENTLVELITTANDVDGNLESYRWEQISGSEVQIQNSNSPIATFTSPTLSQSPGPLQLEFRITVTDNQGASSHDEVIVSVYATLNSPPSAACSITINPGDSFSNAFDRMTAGQVLCLNDGVYSQAMDIPSNLHVRAVHDGAAEIDGGGTLGEEWTGALLQLHGSNSSVVGLKVYHAGDVSDTCSIGGFGNIMQRMSCSHGGTHKHKVPLKISGSNHLVEDNWAYGEGRYVIQCFIGDNITIRRNVARWDSTEPNNDSEPNAAIAIYNCSNITIENNVSLDYGKPESRMRFGGDFYSPQHASVYPEGNQNNYWLGNIAINHAVDTDNRRAMRFDPDSDTFDNVVKDFYIRLTGTAFVSNDHMKNLVVQDCTLKQVETVGSIPGQGEINCGTGADITHRYINRLKTEDLLFPWPYEARIKADMCALGERQSDWCMTNLSLSEYIFNE